MRSVVVDAAALESKQDEFFAAKGTSIATGLVVGRMTAAKDYIVALIETPDIDGSDAGGGKNWDSVDESWIVEHAKEVQRMMPGGMMSGVAQGPGRQMSHRVRARRCASAERSVASGWGK